MDQDNGTFKATRELTLERVAHVPKLGRHNLLSTKRLTTAFDAPMGVYPAAATIRPRFGRKTLVFFSLRPETDLLEIKVRRRADMKEPLTPLTIARSMVTARANPRTIMGFHRLLDYPSEEITRGTARMSDVPLTGMWSPCVQCSESRVRRYAVSKSTESRTNERAERFFIDITGPIHVTSLGGNQYAMLCVDDFARFEFIRFLKHKSDAAKELRELVAEHIAPAGIKIGTVRTDGGGEFEGEFQSLLKELGIKRETTPPNTPQYNGVVERALGLLRDKTVTLLRGMTAGKSDRLWAEAMKYACEMSNRCTTTSLNPGVSPHELWVGHRPTFNHLIPFGTVKYLRRPKPEHKLAPHRAKCIMLGIDTNYPRRTFRVRDLTTGQVIMRQAIIWHPTADAGEATARNTATKRWGGARHGHYSPRPKISHYTSLLGSREAVSEEPESEQHKPGEAGGPEGAFVLERAEHETGGVFGPEGEISQEIESEKAFLSEPEADESGEHSSDDESEPEPDQGGQSGGHQEVPVAMRKLYDSFTGAPQLTTQSRTRNGRDAASLQAPMRAVDVNHLPPEPTTLREAQASPEWPNWQRARKSEMDGQLARQIWEKSERTGE